MPIFSGSQVLSVVAFFESLMLDDDFWGKQELDDPATVLLVVRFGPKGDGKLINYGRP